MNTGKLNHTHGQSSSAAVQERRNAMYSDLARADTMYTVRAVVSPRGAFKINSFAYGGGIKRRDTEIPIMRKVLSGDTPLFIIILHDHTLHSNKLISMAPITLSFIIICTLFVSEGAPPTSLKDEDLTTVGNDHEETSSEEDVLAEEFYQEFPEVVEPSANSSN